MPRDTGLGGSEAAFSSGAFGFGFPNPLPARHMRFHEERPLPVLPDTPPRPNPLDMLIAHLVSIFSIHHPEEASSGHDSLHLPGQSDPIGKLEDFRRPGRCVIRYETKSDEHHGRRHERARLCRMLGTETTERERDGNGEDDEDDAEDAAGCGAGPQAQAMEEQRERDRQVTGRILGDVLPVLRRAPEVFDDGNASAFADKVVETRLALSRCLEGAKTPLDSGAPTPPEFDLDALLRKHAPKPEVLPHQPSMVSVLASLLLARAGTRPPQPQPQPPAAVNGTLPDPGTSLRTAMAAVAAASPQTAGMFKEKASSYRGITRRKRRWEAHVWR